MYANYSQMQEPVHAAPPGYHAYGAMESYGNPRGQAHAFGPPMKPSIGQGRKVLNPVAILACFGIPVVIFVALYAVLTFSIRYTSPGLSNLVSYLLLAVVLVLGYLAFAVMRRRTEGVSEPGWYVFLFVACVIAWVTARVCGNKNFSTNMKPYFDVMNMNVYSSVDPAKYHGQQFMDAGRISFTRETTLDLTKSMGFKNADTYCVAPVTRGTPPEQLPSYDFWAVGLNCCSGHTPDFHCGEYNNPIAVSGLRLMRDDQRAYFRLAVQQAEATYGILAPTPIFLYWMQDPVAEVNAYQDDGYKYFMAGAASFAAFQLAAVVVATIFFASRQNNGEF